MPETNNTEPVGKVIVLSGSATAQSSSGERSLTIGDSIFKNDIIKTDVGSKLQIKFVDNTQVSQDESSTFAIDNFVYNPDPADNSDLLLNMMKGTFRTISGEITKDSPTNFMLKSPQSTIGIRGTIVVSEVTDIYEKHGVEELSPGKILVITDNFGNIRILKVPMKIVEFFKGKPVSEVRDLLLKELDEFQERSPLDLDEGGEDTPLGYTPDNDFVTGLDGQPVDILGADIVPSDFGLTGNAVLNPTLGPGLLGVFNDVSEIPGYNPGSDPGDSGGTDGSNQNVIPGVNEFEVSATQTVQDETDSENISFTFTVTRTGDVENPANVSWSVDGSGDHPADAGDFVGGILPSGTLNFAGGETTQNISVTVSGDTDYEFNEGFALTLSYSDGVGGTTTTTSSNVIIQNDDLSSFEYTVFATEAMQAETDSEGISFTFTVTRTGDVENPANVSWSVDGLGANPADADDFVGGILPSGILNFAEGETSHDVTITVAGDTEFEFDEGFALTLSYSDGSGTTTTTSSNVIIQNDDPPNFEYTAFVTEAVQAETDSGNISFTFTVTRTGDIVAPSDVSWSVDGLGANPADADDFVGGILPSGTLNFAEGETSHDVTITVAGDTEFEFDEGFALTLSYSDGSGGTITESAEATIQNDDSPNIQLAALDGTDGFSVNGIEPSDYSGRSVSNAGDMNGDGFDDFIIGADRADPGGNLSAGESYLVFGGGYGVQQWTGPNADFDLSTLNGENGFTIEGIDSDDYSGRSVSGAGDVNGDGYADLIIGAYGADSSETSYAGESYVVFGGEFGVSGWEESNGILDLENLRNENGFVIEGVDSGDNSGRSVSNAGDVNGDGFDDLIVGAYGADGIGDDFPESGETYLIFGGADGFQERYADENANLDLDSLNGVNGIQIDGIGTDNGAGRNVSNAGDVNGDGFDDFIIGTFITNASGNTDESYLVFGGEYGIQGWTEEDLGRAYNPFNLNDLDGSSGFKINGIEGTDVNGSLVSSAGDINGDGFDDFIIGAYLADPGGNPYAGESYLVFGGEHGVNGWEESSDAFNLGDLNGTNGFSVQGIDPGDSSGFSLSGAGDVNGDGFDDFIIGAYDADPNDNSNAGETYLVFGGEFGVNGWEDPNANLDLENLDGLNGFRIDGEDMFDSSGYAVSGAGDINGDGFDDLIIGATGADPGEDSRAGESYIIFGRDYTGAVDEQGGSAIGTTSDDVMIGGLGNDLLLGLGGSDVIYGGAGDDVINVSDFFRIDGGSGFDTLEFDGINLDLGDIANNKIQGIEKVDLGIDRYDNDLTLSISDVLDISDTTNTLIIGGDEDDSLTVSDGRWYNSGTTDEGGQTYNVYNSIDSQAILHVDTDIDLTYTPAIA